MFLKRMNSLFVLLTIFAMIVTVGAVHYYTGDGIILCLASLLEHLTTPISLFILIGALAYWIYGRKRFLIKKSLYFMMVVVTLCIYNAKHIIDNREQDAAKNNSANEIVKSVVRDMLDNEDIQTNKVTANTHGELAPLINWMKDYLAIIQKQTREMNEGLEKLELDKYLNMKSLENENNIAIVMAKLKDAVDLVKNNKALQNKTMVEAETEWLKVVDGLDVPEGRKKRIVNNGSLIGTGKLSPYEEYMNKMIDAFNAKLDYVMWLNANKGSYYFKGEELIIKSQKDVNEYNKLVLRIQNTTKDVLAQYNSVRDNIEKKISSNDMK